MAGGVLEILHAERDTGQWAGVDAGGHGAVHRLRRRPGPFSVDRDEGVELRIVPGDLVEGMVDQ